MAADLAIRIKKDGLSIAALLGLPCCLIGYSRIAVRIRLTPAGILDSVTFILLVSLVAFLFSAIRRAWVRYVSLYLLSGFLVLFFVGNATYYRFFGDWVHYQIFSQWRSGLEIGGDTLGSLTWWDWCVGIAIPLAMTYRIARRPPKVRLRLACPVILVLLGASITGHQMLRLPAFMANDHIALLYFGRSAIARYAMVYLESDRVERVRSDFSEYYPPPLEGYRMDGVGEYPLLKIPEGGVQAQALIPLDKSHPPNIVLVLMESIRAYEMGACGADPSYTPVLDELARQGMHFRNFYANGTQTTRGEMALHCSFYPNLHGAPIYTSYTGLRLSSLPGILAGRGYKTLWISSHTASSGNKRGFLSQHGIAEFYDGEQLRRAGAPTLGWGPPDEMMFAYAAEILDRQPEPFYAEIMTLSNHWPFQWPYPTMDQTPEAPGPKMYRGYTRGVYYTDWAIGRFMQQMRRRPYFENTIFVFCADHGFWVFPDDPEPDAFRKTEIYFRCPLILYAPKLIQPAACDTLGSQVDFAPTMLHLLGIRARNAFVGRSLLEPDGGRPRFVLMGHTHRWSLRVGNRYLYDVGPEFFLEHPTTTGNGQKFDMSDQHVLRECDEDVLRIGGLDETREVIGQEKARLTHWVEDLLFMNTYMMEWDTVYDERDASSVSESAPASAESDRP